MRRAIRRDNSEKAIVESLEAAGAFVLKKLPVDLLVFYRGSWRLLEAKTPKRNKGAVMQKRQAEQIAFCKAFSIPVCEDAEAALDAIGVRRITDFTVNPVRDP